MKNHALDGVVLCFAKGVPAHIERVIDRIERIVLPLLRPRGGGSGYGASSPFSFILTMCRKIGYYFISRN